MGHSSKVMDGCSQVRLMKAVMFLKDADSDDPMIDDMCAGFLDEAFCSGTRSGIDGRLNNALGWLLPRFQMQRSGHPPRLHQARVAATKRSPSGTRLPYPEMLIKELQELFECGWVRLGLDRVLSRQVLHAFRHPGPSVGMWESRRPLVEV